MATTKIDNAGVTFPDSTLQETAGGSNVNAINVLTASGTWTKPSSLKSIKVTVIGGGGSTPGYNPAVGGGRGLAGGGGGGGASVKFYPAASLPGPQPYTVGGAGGTSSFGAAPVGPISATGGATSSFVTSANPTNIAASSGGVGGVGSGGSLNLTGSAGENSWTMTNIALSGNGGSSILGGGGAGASYSPGGGSENNLGNPGSNYGAGSSGNYRTTNPGSPSPGVNGAPGVVIIEEFY
jgi:hypothetical protein